MEEKFTFGSALKVIFQHIQSSPAVLAERYVDRDRTLVYKWLRDAASPPKKLFPDIIRFVVENSGEPVRVLIRAEMDRHVSEAGLEEKFKGIVGEEPGFAEYLEGMFSLLSAEKTLEKNRMQPETVESPEPQNQPELSPKEMPEQPQQSPVPMTAEHTVHIRLTTPAMANIGFALLASISGEILWLMITCVLRWSYASGIPYDGASVFPAFLRGFLVLPVMVFVMLREDYPSIKALSKAKKLAYIGCYALAGGIGGLLLASPGLENVVAGFLPEPVPQAAFLIFIHALVLSFLPMLALLALLRFPKATPGTFLFLEFGPALLCVLAALPILLSGQLPTGRIWLGGFFPGAVLNLVMFVCARIVFKGYSCTIKLELFEIPQ